MALTKLMTRKDSTGGPAAHPGQVAEGLAARFLERQGLTVLTRNYRCRGGEVDLVCRDRHVIVFVEVRLRRHADYGGASASITSEKRRRIALAAQHYLILNDQTDVECRFDCVLLEALSEAAIEWLRDAFSAP